MPKLHIALNVTRTRVTILSFILAIDLFTFGILANLRISEGPQVFWIFMSTSVPIILSFCLAILALWVLVVSIHLDPVGNSNLWTFSIGELLMYSSMQQTINGTISKIYFQITASLGRFVSSSELSAEQSELIQSSVESLNKMLRFISGATWLGIGYIAPAVLIIRLPLPWRRKWILTGGYLALLTLLSLISAYPYHISKVANGESMSFFCAFLKQYWQPATWTP